MYSYFEGIVDEIGDDYAVLDVGGVGYQLQCPSRALSGLMAGERARLYAHLNVSQDGVALYGFSSREERAMFLRLTSVSRVGPKLALSALSALGADEIAAAIVTEDFAALARAPGMGKKTAQRVILELKERIAAEEAFSGSGMPMPAKQGAAVSAQQEAVTALMALGYTQSVAAQAVASVNEGDVSEIIKAALRALARV